MTPDKGYGIPMWETAFISEVNRARKVKSDAQVATNKNSGPVQKFFLKVAGDDGAPTQFFPNFRNFSETSRAKKLILGLQVNIDDNIIDKANSRRYDVTR